MTEAPFLPRERLKKHQEYFQNIHKHTYLKGRYDKITSVAIPLALASTCIVLIVCLWFHLIFFFFHSAVHFSACHLTKPCLINRAAGCTTWPTGSGRRRDPINLSQHHGFDLLPPLYFPPCKAWIFH